MEVRHGERRRRVTLEVADVEAAAGLLRAAGLSGLRDHWGAGYSQQSSVVEPGPRGSDEVGSSGLVNQTAQRLKNWGFRTARSASGRVTFLLLDPRARAVMTRYQCN